MISIIGPQVEVTVAAVVEENNFRLARLLAGHSFVIDGPHRVGRLGGDDEAFSLREALSRTKDRILVVCAALSARFFRWE